jgi:hypothetical protein
MTHHRSSAAVLSAGWSVLRFCPYVDCNRTGAGVFPTAKMQHAERRFPEGYRAKPLDAFVILLSISSPFYM